MAHLDSIPPQFVFNRQVLDCVVGGVSALDIPRLNVETPEEARQFTLAYGYDVSDPAQLDQLWSTYRRAVALIKEQLLDEGEHIPEELCDPTQLGDLSRLLIIASSPKLEDRDKQRWACAILRVMHVYVHLRNDLFSMFRDEIQAQILKPLQDAIIQDDVKGTTVLGSTPAGGGIKLDKFEIKPFKTTASSVVKLLARPEKVALTLLDKLGVRFVTHTVYDSFRVIRFLVDNHILSYPHIIPDQSNNTLYPVNLFVEVMRELKIRENRGEQPSSQEVEDLLRARLESSKDRAKYLEKSNEFSGPEYRFIKFINRKLITVHLGEGERKRPFRFFYPYEIQVMDQDTYTKNLTGPMAHDEYKNRQRKKARARVLAPLEGWLKK
jgi:uncharacterized protein (TIGR04562 family)